MLKKQDRDRLLAFEKKCYRRILRIRWEQRITNEDVRSRLRFMKNMVQRIMERTLNLFGRISGTKDTMLVKKMMFGMMEGEARRGRPCREWMDDIKECCGEEIRSLNRKAPDRCAWRMVVKTALDTYGR